MAKIERITLHPLKEDGTIDLNVNLYPKTLLDGIVDRSGTEVEIATQQELDIRLAEKVDKEYGKGLSTNDFTDQLKSDLIDNNEKLATIETGAEVNVKADWTAIEGDAEILHKPTTIAGFGITDAYTKTQIDADIKVKIPAEASSQNQLADKAYVDSAVSVSEARFISPIHEKFEDLPLVGINNNDYTFVVTRDVNELQADGIHKQVIKYTKYIWDDNIQTANKWRAEYELYNNWFTPNQWSAINSGIESSDIAKIDAAYNAIHSHDNKSILDGISAADITNWNTKVSANDATITLKKNNAPDSMSWDFSLNQSSDENIVLGIPETAADIRALPDTTKYGRTFDLGLVQTDPTNTTIKFTLKDQDNSILHTGSVQLNEINLNRDRIQALENYNNAFNLKNGEGNYSLQQVANVETEHVKGGLALGNNSVALGIGDTYTAHGRLIAPGDTISTIVETVNPDWQNMVVEYNGQYSRIANVSVDGHWIVLATNLIGDYDTSIAFNIITQVAKGNSSFVAGEYSQAFGEASHAEGLASKAIGNASYAGGYFSVANQAYSFAYGDHATAAGVGQTAVGKYNAVNFEDPFVVGNGQGGALSNAFIVRADGRATVAADPTNALDVATKQYVDTKVTTQNVRKSVYATTGESEGPWSNTMISYSAGLNTGCLVQRDGTQILVPEIPTQNGHAASKKYIDDHKNDTENPHGVTKAQVGLGNVVNTGDSDTPAQNGTTKFTTGGAYTLKTNLETADTNLNTALTNHTSSTNNPHSVTAAQVGLGNCNNTSDADKPISTATQTALNAKLDDSQLVTSWSSTVSNGNIPSEKLVKDSLDAKVDTNNAITGATKCKITYDSKGLVTNGADLSASDIPDLSATYQLKNTILTSISGLSTSSTGLLKLENGTTSLVEEKIKDISLRPSSEEGAEYILKTTNALISLDSSGGSRIFGIVESYFGAKAKVAPGAAIYMPSNTRTSSLKYYTSADSTRYSIQDNIIAFDLYTYGEMGPNNTGIVYYSLKYWYLDSTQTDSSGNYKVVSTTKYNSILITSSYLSKTATFLLYSGQGITNMNSWVISENVGPDMLSA